MYSFEVYYVILAQKISVWEGGKNAEFSYFLEFEPPSHRLILKIKIFFKVKNSKKSEIYRFYLPHIGAVCTKTLTPYRTP